MARYSGPFSSRSNPIGVLRSRRDQTIRCNSCSEVHRRARVFVLWAACERGSPGHLRTRASIIDQHT